MTIDLRDTGAPGKIWFTVRAEDTEQNRRIHDGFKKLSMIECRNDYTFALGKLLEYYEADAKTEMLWAAILAMERRIDDLEQHNEAKAKKEPEPGAF